MARRRTENMQVIVCGPNRSGTSLMMRCLEMAGFKMAEDLMPGDEGNKYGYYESKRFKRYCYDVIERKNGAQKFLPYLLIPSLIPSKSEDIRKLLDKKGKWAWKVPLAVFVLDELFEVAENMIVIFMSRPIDDVIKSMIRHCKVKGVTPFTEDVYAQLYDNAFNFFQAYKHKKIEVDFLDLVENEKMVMNEILDILGLETNYDCTAVDIREVHFK